jgi:hypothetical protein
MCDVASQTQTYTRRGIAKKKNGAGEEKGEKKILHHAKSQAGRNNYEKAKGGICVGFIGLKIREILIEI